MKNRYASIKLSLLVITAVFVLAAPFAHAALQCCAYIFENPLQSQNLIDLLISVRKQIFPFVITIVSFLIIVTGFRYVYHVATGEAVGVKQTKEIFKPAIIGLIIIAAGGALLEAIRIFFKGF